MSHSRIDDTNNAVSSGSKAPSGVSKSASSDPSKFQPIDRTNTTPDFQPPDQRWTTILQSHCSYGASIFEEIMLNFIKNPNVTSSILFRADILYDTDAINSSSNGTGNDQTNVLTSDDQPRPFELPGWTQDRVIVRVLVPRNQQLDRPLTQTCTLLSKKTNDDTQEHLVVYSPHADTPDEIPFYHPRVARIAFHHTFRATMDSGNAQPERYTPGLGSISVSYKPFTTSPEIDNKLHRTGLKLLQTIHKHGQGQLGGYKKRVHHDQVIPQKEYQDTYSRLKAKYGRKLVDGWVEVTDPGKHVFEDLGIAAFCLELWRQMYELPDTAEEAQAVAGAEREDIETSLEQLNVADDKRKKPPFPGFVDIGCGNGLLVYILISEGYPGFGFDARERKTWDTYPPQIRQHLRQSLLVPELLRPGNSSGSDTTTEDTEKSWHSGLFNPGTFIISNHADELTAWTPLLAHLNNSAFIAIPCCSHDLAGSRFRAPDSTKAQKAQSDAAKQEAKRNEHAARLPQQQEPEPGAPRPTTSSAAEPELRLSQAAETGSLKRTLVHKKMASAYSTLCAYVSAIADAVGFDAEEEVLRIPSTRNQSIIGRRRKDGYEGGELGERRRRVAALVEEELGRGIESIGLEWVERAEKLAKKPGSGH